MSGIAVVVEMVVDVSTHLACAPSEAQRHVRTMRLLEYVTAPLVRFVPEQEMPAEIWSDGTYRVQMYLLGVVPLGWQAIVLSFPEKAGAFCVRDNGYSPLISRWDHMITIAPEGEGTRYRDRVAIEAGLLTPLIWMFAQVFYRHRQRRWRRLVRQQFRYA
jgi:ligand-binding SRPBCC domain-containing protein